MLRALFLAVAILAALAIASPSSEHGREISMGFESKENTADLSEQPDTNSTGIETASKLLSRCTDTNQCSFTENFKTKDTKRWTFAHDYANGESFASWWSRDRVLFDRKKKRMVLSIGRAYRHGKPYVSGQTQSNKWHGYGCYEVRMKPANQEGLITTFFSFTGKYDAAPGKPKKHNEVDLEFVYKRKYKKIMLQANYFTNGRGNHEHLIKLPFNPVRRMHNYAFKWTGKRITWYVDGRKVYSTARDIPKIAQGPHKIMMSLWPVSAYSAAWAGNYQWRGPKRAMYAAMRFTKGEDCKIYNKFW